MTGIRKDRYAMAHRLPVEQDKPAEARGTYVHPELFAPSEPDRSQARIGEPVK